MRNTVGIERIRDGGETGGDDEQIAGALCIVAEREKRIVCLAETLARLSAEIVDNEDALLLQFFKTVMKLGSTDSDNGLAGARKNNGQHLTT